MITRRRVLRLSAALPFSFLLPRAFGGAPTTIDKACDVKHAFAPGTGHPTVGLLTKLKLGTKNCATDFRVTNPENPTRKRDCVAVIKRIQWNTQPTGAITIQCCVSKALRDYLKTLIAGAKPVAVSMQIRIYEWDAAAKKIYRSFATTTDALGKTDAGTGGGTGLSISGGDDAAHEVESPENFLVSMTVAPETKAQELHVATSQTTKFVKPWGIESSPGR